MAGNNYLSPSYSTNQISNHAANNMNDIDTRGNRIHGDNESSTYYQRSHSIGCDMPITDNTNTKKCEWMDEINTKKYATFTSDNNCQSKTALINYDDNWFGGFPNEGTTDGSTKTNLTDSTSSTNNCLTERQLDGEEKYQRYSKQPVAKTSEKYFDALDIKKQPTTPISNVKTPITKKTTTAEDDAWNLLID